MKKLLLLLVCMIATIAVNAQDIIVKKDGTTIQAKVLRVTVDEVKYKVYYNQNGPTLTIRISELLAINYEDGEKETFNTSATPSTNNTNIVTHETATQYSDDASLLRIYNSLHTKSQLFPEEYLKRKAKRLKLSGYIVGGSLVIVGVSMYATAYGDGLFYGIGSGFVGLGLAVGLPCIIKGHRLSKQSVNTSSLWDTQFHFNNGSSMNLGVDALSDNTAYNKTLGLGVRYNF